MKEIPLRRGPKEIKVLRSLNEKIKVAFLFLYITINEIFSEEVLELKEEENYFDLPKRLRVHEQG